MSHYINTQTRRIIRHTKVKGESSPYDGNLVYWATRMGRYIGLSKSKAKLLKRQRGKCNQCKLTFRSEDKLETDHIIAIKAGGEKSYENLQILHKHCHDVKTKTDLVAIERYKRRKEWNKVYKEFQKQFNNANWVWNTDIPTLV